jgi:hypothetical protein
MSFIPIQLKNAPILVRYSTNKYPNATNFINNEIMNNNRDIICHYANKQITINKQSIHKKFYKKVFSEFAKDQEELDSSAELFFFVIHDRCDSATSKIIGTLLNSGKETDYGIDGHMYYDAYRYNNDDSNEFNEPYFFKCTEI